MGFDYEKSKSKSEHNDSFWVSYSDLFMMLSVVFLLLYTITSLRSGSFGIEKNMEAQRIAYENEDLKQQIKVYETLKEQQVRESSPEDTQVYEELMGQLHLLKDEAKDENMQLKKKVAENETKEKALNKYQQIIRNIINSNVLAQARLQRRDKIIKERESEISNKSVEIRGLKKVVDEKQKSIAQSELEVARINKKLENKIQEVKRAYSEKRITEEKMEKSISDLRRDSVEKVTSLQESKRNLESELNQVSSKLNVASRDLQSANSAIALKDQEKQKLVDELTFVKSNYKQQMGNLQAEFDAKREREQRELRSALADAKASAGEIAAREAELRAKTEKDQQALNRQLGSLSKKIQDAEGKLSDALASKDAIAQEASSMREKTVALKKDLNQMRELADARKNLARRIKQNFSKAGVKADVDSNTGDVIISFGSEYFDTGKSDLKSGMRGILERSIPIYSQSLFEDKATAEKLSSVEIVGFSSPTYQGRYIDPDSLEERDKAAVNYNLDLSYYRARSIFSHIFDTKKMVYKHQKDLLPLVKVTGRSYLAEKKGSRNVAGDESGSGFCGSHDCKKAQRVIIRFELE